MAGVALAVAFTGFRWLSLVSGDAPESPVDGQLPNGGLIRFGEAGSFTDDVTLSPIFFCLVVDSYKGVPPPASSKGG